MTPSTQTKHCLPHRPAIFLSLLCHPIAPPSSAPTQLPAAKDFFHHNIVKYKKRIL